LDYINLYNLVRLESSSVNEVYRKAYDALRNHTAGHQNAFFNMIDRGLNGPNAGRDAETLSLLDQWLQRPLRGTFVDLHAFVPVCGDRGLRARAGPHAAGHRFPVAAQSIPARRRSSANSRVRRDRLHFALLDGALLCHRAGSIVVESKEGADKSCAGIRRSRNRFWEH